MVLSSRRLRTTADDDLIGSLSGRDLVRRVAYLLYGIFFNNAMTADPLPHPHP
jgi:hypothetical protein